MRAFISIVCALAAVSLGRAGSPTPQPTPPPACTAPEFRQFDFWLGKWNVTNPRLGRQVGTSEVTRVSGGCAIREEWRSSNGVHGMSINYYDAADRKWHQDWVGSDGTILHLRGDFTGKAMILSSESNTAQNHTPLNRISWTLLDAGKVKQEWASSSDNGATWKVSFAGIYEMQP